MKKLSSVSGRPLLLLEVNEVPWRLIDRYIDHPRLPRLRAFFSRSQTFTTQTVDPGELSPWVIWPTLHRGVSQAGHGVEFLGQDPATFRGTPIWEEYRKRHLSIGVCGSLQSWPPRPPGEGGFYLPDTFAHDESCIPRRIEPLQRFNLDQTSRNGRVVRSGSWRSKTLWNVLLHLPRLGVRASTWFRIAAQLVSEKRDHKRSSRRVVFQALLFWDVFRSLYRPEAPPAFASFFTNHIASLMHRYWHDIFPDDFPERQGQAASQEPAMLFALQELDRILGEVMIWCDRNPELLVAFASGMGQGPKRWERFEGVAFAVSDLKRLMASMGVGAGEWKPLLAMVPQVAVAIENAEVRSRLKQRLEASVTASGWNLFSVGEIGNELSISVRTPPKADIANGGFQGPSGRLGWAEAGIEAHSVDNGTAYHIPEGVLAFFSKQGEANPSRTLIPADQVKALLLEKAGVPWRSEVRHEVDGASGANRGFNSGGPSGILEKG